jgi:hypothetical protein
MRGIAAAAIATEVLHLEAFRDGFDPEFVCDAMHDVSAMT